MNVRPSPLAQYQMYGVKVDAGAEGNLMRAWDEFAQEALKAQPTVHTAATLIRVRNELLSTILHSS